MSIHITILHIFCNDPEQKEPCLKNPGSEWTNLQLQFNLHSYKIHNVIYNSLNPLESENFITILLHRKILIQFTMN